MMNSMWRWAGIAAVLVVGVACRPAPLRPADAPGPEPMGQPGDPGRFESGRSWLVAPPEVMRARAKEQDPRRELLRCYEQELRDPVQHSTSAKVLLSFDGDGAHVRVVQDETGLSSGFASCLESTVQSWDVGERPAGEKEVIPLEFGSGP